MLELTSELALTLPPEVLLVNAEARLLARIRGETPPAPSISMRSKPQQAWPWLHFTGVMGLAALLFIVTAGVLRRSLTDYRIGQRLERRYAAQEISCQSLSSETGEFLGTLALGPSGLLLVLIGVPPEGQVYQAWEITDVPATLGTWSNRIFEVEGLRTGELETGRLKASATFGVTLEPASCGLPPAATPIIAVPLGNSGL